MALLSRSAPTDATDVTSQTGTAGTVARFAAAATRFSLGWVFLWAFLDKTFGLGYATKAEDAWLDGGSPTYGFLNFAATGPFEDFYKSIAGDAWADWLFMIGLAGSGRGRGSVSAS